LWSTGCLPLRKALPLISLLALLPKQEVAQRGKQLREVLELPGKSLPAPGSLMLVLSSDILTLPPRGRPQRNQLEQIGHVISFVFCWLVTGAIYVLDRCQSGADVPDPVGPRRERH
jgi:hypothetical protein